MSRATLAFTIAALALLAIFLLLAGAAIGAGGAHLAYAAPLLQPYFSEGQTCSWFYDGTGGNDGYSGGWWYVDSTCMFTATGGLRIAALRVVVVSGTMGEVDVTSNTFFNAHVHTPISPPVTLCYERSALSESVSACSWAGGTVVDIIKNPSGWQDALTLLSQVWRQTDKPAFQINITAILASDTATETPTPTLTPSPSATATSTDTPTPSHTPTSTSTPTDTSTPTHTPSSTPTPTPANFPYATSPSEGTKSSSDYVVPAASTPFPVGTPGMIGEPPTTPVGWGNIVSGTLTYLCPFITSTIVISDTDSGWLSTCSICMGGLYTPTVPSTITSVSLVSYAVIANPTLPSSDVPYKSIVIAPLSTPLAVGDTPTPGGPTLTPTPSSAYLWLGNAIQVPIDATEFESFSNRQDESQLVWIPSSPYARVVGYVTHITTVSDPAWYSWSRRIGTNVFWSIANLFNTADPNDPREGENACTLWGIFTCDAIYNHPLFVKENYFDREPPVDGIIERWLNAYHSSTRIIVTLWIFPIMYGVSAPTPTPTVTPTPAPTGTPIPPGSVIDCRVPLPKQNSWVPPVFRDTACWTIVPAIGLAGSDIISSILYQVFQTLHITPFPGLYVCANLYSVPVARLLGFELPVVLLVVMMLGVASWRVARSI